MAKGGELDTPTKNQTTAVSAEPMYLVDFDDAFTDIYYSTNGEVSWNGETWAHQGLDVAWSGGVPTFRLSNPRDPVWGWSSGFWALARRSGKIIQVYQCYRTGTGTTDITQPYSEFIGEISNWSVNDAGIIIRTRRFSPNPKPHLKIVPSANAFNHLPKPGTVIETLKGRYVIGD